MPGEGRCQRCGPTNSAIYTIQLDDGREFTICWRCAALRVLTGNQLKVWGFVGDFRQAHGYSPTIQDVATHFGVQLNAVAQTIRRLRDKGWLTFDDKMQRTMQQAVGA